MYSDKKVGVVIPAAGTGTRFGGTIAKQFLELEGEAILARTIRHFQEHRSVDCIAIAGSNEGLEEIVTICSSIGATKVRWIGLGGTYRQDSVWNGLLQLHSMEVDIVLVHDAVRPFVTEELIDRVLNGALMYGAAIPAMPPNDTVKIIGKGNRIVSTPERETLRLAQTPQGFQIEILLQAFRQAKDTGFLGTDDAGLVEAAGLPVVVVEGVQRNIKITTPEDMAIATVFAAMR